jgi:DNA-binding CsgD family transcriptional regulator
VQGSNSDGVWNEAGVSLPILITPPWWKTNSFLALWVGLFLALLWAANQFRMRQVQHAFELTLEARVGERTRVTRELHDTLLQSFHGLLLRFQTASYLLPEPRSSPSEPSSRSAKVIVLTTYEGDVHILRALKAGAQSYLLKNTLHSELLRTIRAVHAGKRSLSPEVSFQVAQHVSDQTLTPAEVVVLRLIAAGNANKQIADQLGITEDTVKGRVKSILAKLDANDRAHAAIIGLKRGIIEL